MVSMQTPKLSTGTSRDPEWDAGWESPGTPSCRSYWSEGLLGAFSRRMATHDLCESRAMMMGDRGYALEQLDLANRMVDEPPHEMAMAQSHHFEPPPPSLLYLN